MSGFFLRPVLSYTNYIIIFFRRCSSAFSLSFVVLLIVWGEAPTFGPLLNEYSKNATDGLSISSKQVLAHVGIFCPFGRIYF